MKFQLLALSLLSLFMIACGQEEMTPEKLAEMYHAKYSKHNAMSYSIDYKIKFFSQTDDTSRVEADVDLVRMPEDSVFTEAIWIQSKDSLVRFYDTSNIYIISQPEEKVYRYKKEEDFAIRGNIAGDVIEISFVNTGKFIDLLKDSSISVSLEETELEGVPVWHWISKYDDDGDFINSRKDYWIRIDDTTMIRSTYTVDYQGENQYNEWNLSNITFDGVDLETLKARFGEVAGNYTIEDYKPRSPEESKPLDNGTTIPDLKGELYGSGDSVSLSDYRGKMLLLDFWYMDCFPCIKAIPHLSEIHHKYADQGLQVIGIDPFDNNEKDLERMPNFLEKNPLDYPILFINKEQPKNFKVYAYPTFYLVDRDGKIIYSQIGHGDNTGAELDSVIQIHIN